MTMKLFSRKNKKTNRRRGQRPELKVVEEVDFARRGRLWTHICTLRRDMFPENVEVYEDNKKSLSTY